MLMVIMDCMVRVGAWILVDHGLITLLLGALTPAAKSPTSGS